MRTFQCFIDPLFSSQITYQLHQPNWKLICTLSISLFSWRCHIGSRSSTYKTILSCLVFSLNIRINICCVRISLNTFALYFISSSFLVAEQRVLVEYKHFFAPPSNNAFVMCAEEESVNMHITYSGYVRKFY